VSIVDVSPPRPRTRSSPPPNDRQVSSYYSDEDDFERVDNTRYIRSKSSSRRPDVEQVGNAYYIETRSMTPSRTRSRSRSPLRSGNRPYEDDYGRLIRGEIPKETRPFHAILPDNPFGVIRESYNRQDPSEVQHMPILQFRTWRTEAACRDTRALCWHNRQELQLRPSPVRHHRQRRRLVRVHRSS
jgi:hypothetical protein